MSIVVFDSGVGGLTVLNELLKSVSYEDFIYLADEKRCPYGNKDDQFIVERLSKICDYIKQFKPRAVVIACNTASRFKSVFTEKLSVPVFDVILPTVNYAETFLKRDNKVGKVLLLATKSTVDGGVYQKALKERNIYCKAIVCDFFVPYIENLRAETEEFSIRLAKLFSSVDLNVFDGVIYGCTHYGLIDEKIKNFLNNSCRTFSCGLPTALSVKKSLYSRSRAKHIGKFCKIKYFTTENAENFLKKLNYYLNRLPNLAFSNLSCDNIHYIMI